MESLDRYLCMLKGEAVDFVPRVPILMQFAAESIGSNYGAFASDYRVLVEANLHCAEVFGMDQVSAISDPYRETDASARGSSSSGTACPGASVIRWKTAGISPRCLVPIRCARRGCWTA